MRTNILIPLAFILLSLVATSCAGAQDEPLGADASAVAYADTGGAFSTIDASGGAADEAGQPFWVPATDDGSTPVVGPAGPPDAGNVSDAAADGAPPLPFDAGVAGACATPPAEGDLVIDELMIASVTGAGDHGEWLEVESTRACAVDIVGLHGECPTGAKVVTFDVMDDVWIPPFGTFLVADSSNPALEHDLPGTLVTWTGEPGDVLRNKGTTITLSMNSVLIDVLTYPALKLTIGATWSFPSDCDASNRGDFTYWQVATSSWFPGFAGTPNAPNGDVHCPQ